MTAKLVYITAPNRQAAIQIARVLVGERLAACANILDGATSIYWWNDEMQEDQETVIFLKTTSSKVSALISKVLEIHDYVCPCIVTIPIEDGNPAFLQWIGAETGDSQPNDEAEE